jgi:hypothetical protein
MSDWLELELAHQLAPTEAPDALWHRVSGAIQSRPTPPRRRPVWLPVAAIVAVMVGTGAMWMSAKGREPVFDLQHLAALDLDAREPLDLNSSEPREIAEWAKREAGVSVSLRPAASAHLLGARIVRHRGRPIAAISYEVDGRAAKLLVAHAASNGSTPHGRPSWQTAGQSYALAFAETSRAEAACLICHSSL